TRGAGAAGDRLRRAVPGGSRRGGLPAGPGPGAGRRRPFVRLVRPMSRIKEFNLPDLGEGLTEGEILNWLVKVGDTIELNQPIVEVETAKAAVEIPSPYAGVVTALHHQAGETVDVGSPIISYDIDPQGIAADDAAPDGVAEATGGGEEKPAIQGG